MNPFLCETELSLISAREAITTSPLVWVDETFFWQRTTCTTGMDRQDEDVQENDLVMEEDAVGPVTGEVAAKLQVGHKKRIEAVSLFHTDFRFGIKPCAS